MSDDSLLPINSSLLERGLEQAWQKLLGHLDPPFPHLMTPERTPAAFLPYLAADRGVSEWQSTDSEQRKRDAVALSWPIKRLAGTKAALIHAIESMGYTAEVTPWYALSPQGQPYSFRVISRTTAGFAQGDFDRLMARLEDAKAERDTLNLDITTEVHGQVRTAIYTSSGAEVTVYPASPQPQSVTGHAFGRAAALSPSTLTRVYPQPAASAESVASEHMMVHIDSPSTVTTVFPARSGDIAEHFSTRIAILIHSPVTATTVYPRSA